MFYSVKAAARASPLSRAQVVEIEQELSLFHPHVKLDGVFIDSRGDIDLVTSLREMGQTDFFTKEIDDLLLRGECRIAVHSAKDLPIAPYMGLKLICVTNGKDPKDALVLRKGETIDSLAPNSLIATSSERREMAVSALRSDLCFRDLRGTICRRLALLETGEADGVVVAEAALIRLGLTHLNRLILPGPTTPLQGQLAVLAREEDQEMQELFQCLHAL